MQAAGASTFQHSPEHAHIPACVPAHACGFAPQAQQFVLPMNFAPQMMQVQQPAMQHVDAETPQALSRVPKDDEDSTDLQKCGQTEVSSVESTADDASVSSESAALPQRPP